MEVRTIYVSKNGEVKSIGQALEIANVMRKGKDMTPVNIILQDEEYYICEPIEIGADISYVTIEGENKTLISGGIKVDNFVRDTFNGKECVSADLSGIGALEFTDFYVNGKAALVPRYPKNDTLSAESVEDNDPFQLSWSKWFIAQKKDFDVISKFKNLKDCIISFNHFWIDEHTPIESVDIKQRKITFEYASRFSISSQTPQSTLEYYIEYVAEMFEEPGQWYYDKALNKLYYMPEDAKSDPSQIEGYIPVAEKLLFVEGTERDKVRGVQFKNIDFAYTKGDYKSIGDDISYPKKYYCYASDKQSVCNAHAGIEFKHAEECSVEDCNIYCFGTHGINLYDGCKNINIRRNNICNIGAGGIVVAGGAYGSDETVHTCKNVLEDNRILNCGKRYFASCGILLKHTYSNRIVHNEIGYLYYTGISCGWVWGYRNSICHDNIIEKNHIHHLGQGKLSDMGGVYTLGIQQGTVIRNNLIHDIKSRHYGGWALYTDEGSSQIVLENNICYNATDNIYHQHYGSGNIVRNNIFAFSGNATVAYTHKGEKEGLFVENNILISCGKPIFCIGFSLKTPDGKLTEEDKGKISEIVSKYNLVFDIERDKTVIFATDRRDCELETTQNEFLFDCGSVAQDPMFEDIRNLKFCLDENSPAYKVGFKKIDMSDVGVR